MFPIYWTYHFFINQDNLKIKKCGFVNDALHFKKKYIDKNKKICYNHARARARFISCFINLFLFLFYILFSAAKSTLVYWIY